MMTAYTVDVRRFGGEKPFVDEDGRRFNLKHKTSFEPDAVQTDGNGNIVDMPLLADKQCFGRPERFLRGAHESATPPYSGRNKTHEWRLTRCQRCPVMRECSDVVTERIESSSAVGNAFTTWDDATEGMPGKERFKRRAGRLWDAFLRAIEGHGGWTNVNDKRLAEHEVAEAFRRKDKQKRQRAEARKRARDRRRGVAPRITYEFLVAVEAERSRRLQILLDLRGKPYAPRWITRLSPEGCERTADVWAAMKKLERAGERVTGKAVADHLIKVGRDQGASPDSLKTRVYKDFDRIFDLERDHAGVTIWPAFGGHC